MRSAAGDPYGNGMLTEEHNDIEFLCQDGRPLQLVKYDKRTGRFSVEPEAVQALLAVEGNVGFCALAGKYRTGKSFLLNQLLGLTGTGFRVNPSTTACTEGIWIWSKPIYNHTESLNIFFMDTEGLDSVDSNADHDSKIFALAMLLSSYFMFNSVGTIDESSINQLALVTHLVKNIAVSSDAQSTSMYELSQYSPKFLWILRDFVLEVRDVRGNPATPPQYLESALCDVGHVRLCSTRSATSARRVERSEKASSSSSVRGIASPWSFLASKSKTSSGLILCRRNTCVQSSCSR